MCFKNSSAICRFSKEKWCIIGLIQAEGGQFTLGISFLFRGGPKSLWACGFVSILQVAADLFMLRSRKTTQFPCWKLDLCAFILFSRRFIASAHHIKRNCRPDDHQSPPVRLCKLTQAMGAAPAKASFGIPVAGLGAVWSWLTTGGICRESLNRGVCSGDLVAHVIRRLPLNSLITCFVCSEERLLRRVCSFHRHTYPPFLFRLDVKLLVLISQLLEY